LLAGCGGEIARIDGLPETRDMADVAWPRLVDTPAVPTDSLLPETGVAALASLDAAQETVLTRAADPGPPRVAVAELGGRVARIRQQAMVDTGGIDQADMADRAARLSQVRARPVDGIDAAALQARALRVAQAQAQGVSGVDAADLQARLQRIDTAQMQPPGSVGEGALLARANRVKGQAQSYGGTIDRTDLARRSQRVTMAAANPLPLSPDLSNRKPRQSVAERSVGPTPKPKPVLRRQERSAPVISDAFRKRAEEARRRARERATSAPVQ